MPMTGFEKVNPHWKKRRQSFDAPPENGSDQDINTFKEKFWETSASNSDPAKIMLGSFEESYQQLLSGENYGLGDADLQSRALNLAKEWRIKLRVKAEGPEVLRFLNLLAGYNLTVHFDRQEIGGMAASFSLNNTHPGLCQFLGITGNIKMSMAIVNKHCRNSGIAKPLFLVMLLNTRDLKAVPYLTMMICLFG